MLSTYIYVLSKFDSVRFWNCLMYCCLLLLPGGCSIFHNSVCKEVLSQVGVNSVFLNFQRVASGPFAVFQRERVLVCCSVDVHIYILPSYPPSLFCISYSGCLPSLIYPYTLALLALVPFLLLFLIRLLWCYSLSWVLELR